jgi:hypothetical protein
VVREPHAVAILACDNPEAIVLDFMQPQVAGGQLVGLCGKAGRDESGRKGTDWLDRLELMIAIEDQFVGPQLRRLLSARRKRPRDHRAPEQRDELAAFQRIELHSKRRGTQCDGTCSA